MNTSIEILTVIAAVVLGFCFAASAEVISTQPPYPTFGSIEQLDPVLENLIAADAKIERLADGLIWSEGPVWVRDGGYLLLSDVPANTVYKWKEGQGIAAYLKPSGFLGQSFQGKEPGSNGLTLDHEGRLVLCQHGQRQVGRMDAPLSSPAPKFTPLAQRYDGKRLNSPNDLVYNKAGDLYFTDPPYGLAKNVDDPTKELAFQGVYRLSKGGKLSLIIKEMERPNGLALSPDEKVLYVANSHGPRLIVMSYDVQPDGSVNNGRVFFDAQHLAKQGRRGVPDGMKVDRDGNIWATGPGGVLILDPAGKHLGTILTGVPTANCAWGDDGSTLYICANKWLAGVKTRTKGAGW